MTGFHSLMSYLYAIALGSNRRHGAHGAPAPILRGALAAMAGEGLSIERVSKIRSTRAFGPAGRSFANAAALVATDLNPPELLGLLKAIERGFGRRRARSP